MLLTEAAINAIEKWIKTSNTADNEVVLFFKNKKSYNTPELFRSFGCHVKRILRKSTII